MAGMNQSDQIEALTRLLVHLHRRVPQARPANLRQRFDPQSPSKVAKLCGTTAETVLAWENGTLEPTTNQAIAWLTALYTADRRQAAE